MAVALDDLMKQDGFKVEIMEMHWIGLLKAHCVQRLFEKALASLNHAPKYILSWCLDP